VSEKKTDELNFESDVMSIINRAARNPLLITILLERAMMDAVKARREIGVEKLPVCVGSIRRLNSTQVVIESVDQVANARR